MIFAIFWNGEGFGNCAWSDWVLLQHSTEFCHPLGLALNVQLLLHVSILVTSDLNFHREVCLFMALTICVLGDKHWRFLHWTWLVSGFAEQTWPSFSVWQSPCTVPGLYYSCLTELCAFRAIFFAVSFFTCKTETLLLLHWAWWNRQTLSFLQARMLTVWLLHLEACLWLHCLYTYGSRSKSMVCFFVAVTEVTFQSSIKKMKIL